MSNQNTKLIILLVEIELALKVINARYSLQDSYTPNSVDLATRNELFNLGKKFALALERRKLCKPNSIVEEVSFSIYKCITRLPIAPKQFFYDGQFCI